MPPPPSTSDSPLIRVQENWGRVTPAPEALTHRTARDLKAPEHNDPAFQARCLLLFEGERREYRDGIELLPVAEALADPTLVLA